MSLGCVSAFIVVFCIEGIWSYAGTSKCGKVHLTVSPQDSTLEMNWVTDCIHGENIPDYIVLSSKNIQDRDEDHEVLIMIKYSDNPSGYFRTKIKFGDPWLPGGWEYNERKTGADPGLHCFPYWISSVNKNITIDSKCFSIQPTWMFDNRQYLGEKAIGSIMIPGTHNSGSFKGVPAILENYILNQDRSVWTQLVFGIRYLDFRIGYYGKDGFYINHDLIRVTKVRPLFQEIKKFLQLAPDEVVVLDFHRFPYPSNFTLDLHKKFLDLVYEEFGSFAYPGNELRGSRGPTFNEIWAKKKHLIICYGNRNVVLNNSWLWNPLPQYWANTKSISELKQYCRKAISEHDLAIPMNPLWAIMAELTPQPFDVIFGTNSLRKIAQNVDGLITKWFRDEWGNNSNVVATDFFLGNDIINVAIDINRRGKS